MRAAWAKAPDMGCALLQMVRVAWLFVFSKFIELTDTVSVNGRGPRARPLAQ